MPIRLIDESERKVVEAIAALTDSNPFLPERVKLEKQALGRAFVEGKAVWHAEANLYVVDPNVAALGEVAEKLVPRLRDRLAKGARAGEEELLLYEAVARYFLFQRHDAEWWALIMRGEAGERTTVRLPGFAKFAADVADFLAIPGVSFPFETDAAHLFAWAFQVRRAFHHTFRQIFGGSMPAARLRAAVWQSIFTHDGRRYRRSLYRRMGDVTTLITGESGTGKELVARAIGGSRYIPFDSRSQSFADDYTDAVQAVNLSALSPTLIESELFGHKRGAFTGAVEDRAGWLEACGPLGAVFLDEIGELDAAIQVKLLRVLQTRTFSRIGESKERPFAGKIIAATNRDLAEEMSGGRFRADLYYRLCADVVRTPPLREQLADSPGDLRNLCLILARRIAGDAEAEALASEAERWIVERLGTDYPWPGNVRELEQCVRNVMIRGEYHPPSLAREEPGDDLFEALREGTLSADDLLRHYCTRVFVRTGSYLETARRLGIDRRTVRAKVDPGLIAPKRGSNKLGRETEKQ
jgi:transcriptional regulator with AAA-type ATPase domain